MRASIKAVPFVFRVALPIMLSVEQLAKYLSVAKVRSYRLGECRRGVSSRRWCLGGLPLDNFVFERALRVGLRPSGVNI